MKLTYLMLMLSFSLLGACATLGPIKPKANGSRVALTRDYKEIKDADQVKGDSVEVFYKKNLPTPVKEIGIVEAIVYGEEVGLEALLPELRRQAALLRANAIGNIEFTRFDHGKPALHGTALAVEVKSSTKATP